MIIAALSLGLIAFVGVLRILQAEAVARQIVTTAQDALQVISNPDLSDIEKERKVRRASLSLFGRFLAIAGIGLASLVAAAAIVWSGSVAGLYGLDAAMSVAMGWPFLIGSTFCAIALWLTLDQIGGQRGAPAKQAGEVPYGPMEQALHNFAFASPARQRRLGALETRLYSSWIDEGRAARPVFVTSLPRAGTTIMLNVLAETPEFASATYRHMPFTLAPLLWGRIGPLVQKIAERTERAHGDGIEVSGDSPEAFEEMLWMAFWPEHYRPDRIETWSAEDHDAAFARYFRTHMAKIVASKPGASRYVSKNNANIARLPLLDTICPDATIVIPVREPRAQVASLMRLHERFLDLHAREPFGRRYMEGLGHFEFGQALRPVAFGGTTADVEMASGADFWLRYWIGAYEHVLATAGRSAVFVDHDALCAAPHETLPALAEAIGADATDVIVDRATIFRSPGPPPEIDSASPPLLAHARAVHAALLDRALAPAAPSHRRKVIA
ncbi:Sulfotransferase family protein [Roseivivax halotolerans]|uniref:Sulfotransferase family protein n=1 Tax=Roseivivax halotolerans TaxID=93684 RepID=A0A1I6A4W3_9RHOB|nr:sulfotransferase [Roseivivax halotolerans]SFQ63708.1 Sulfotransferase family protein [Roseivivax halotolerans]